MLNIKFSAQSVNDLKEIKQYISLELFNEASVVKLINKIIDCIRNLGEFPFLGSPLSSKINLETDYRFIVCHKYIVFYRTDAHNLYIVRILSSRRNCIKILFDISND